MFPHPLPNFLIIGAQKAGTSSLWQYLRSHPQVFMPAIKEVNFFSRPAQNLNLAEYATYFADAGDALAVGEASPTYSMFPVTDDVPSRIKALIPDVRLIYLMRDPVERMRSAYRHRLSAGTERRPIGQALLSESSYLHVSMYATQIDRYRRAFGVDQMLLLTAEQLRSNRAETLRSVLEFVGVDCDWQPSNLAVEYNTREEKARAPRPTARVVGDLMIRSRLFRFVPHKGVSLLSGTMGTRAIEESEVAVTPDLRERLRGLLRSDVERLRQWMPRSFDGWGQLD